MNTTINPLKQYQAEDRHTALRTAMLFYLLLGFILLFPNLSGWATNYNAQLCLFSGGFFLLFVGYYDWKNRFLNLTLALIYATLLYCEHQTLGFPGMAVYTDAASLDISKGMFLDLFLWLLPSVYIGIKILLIIPLLAMIRKS